MGAGGSKESEDQQQVEEKKESSYFSLSWIFGSEPTEEQRIAAAIEKELERELIRIRRCQKFGNGTNKSTTIKIDEEKKEDDDSAILFKNSQDEEKKEDDDSTILFKNAQDEHNEEENTKNSIVEEKEVQDSPDFEFEFDQNDIKEQDLEIKPDKVIEEIIEEEIIMESPEEQSEKRNEIDECENKDKEEIESKQEDNKIEIQNEVKDNLNTKNQTPQILNSSYIHKIISEGFKISLSEDMIGMIFMKDLAAKKSNYDKELMFTIEDITDIIFEIIKKKKQDNKFSFLYQSYHRIKKTPLSKLVEIEEIYDNIISFFSNLYLNPECFEIEVSNTNEKVEMPIIKSNVFERN